MGFEEKELTYRVFPIGSLWEVTLDGGALPPEYFADRDEAVGHARFLAIRDRPSRLVAYDRSGRVELDQRLGAELPRKAG